MASGSDLKAIFAETRPLIERWLDLRNEFAALRDAATEKGFDWGQIKALAKAHAEDERDEAGDARRVQKIIDKADCAQAYADMLGLAGTKLNEKNSFPETPTATAVRQDRPAPAKLSVQEPSEPTGSGGAQDRSRESIPPPPSQAKAGVEAEAMKPSQEGADAESVSRLAAGRTAATTTENGRDGRERPPPHSADISTLLPLTDERGHMLDDIPEALRRALN